MVLNNLVNLGTDCLGIGKVSEAFFGYLGERGKLKYALQEPARNKYMIENVGDAISKHPDLDVAYEANGLSISEKSLESLEARAELRQRTRNIQKQEHLETVVNYACEELQFETKVSPEPLDEQWATRFFDYACDVTTEELQRIWGKILAGEVKRPKRFSLRTLDVLRNLSQGEAKLFSEISSFVINLGGTVVITNNGNMLKKYNISYGKILMLCDAGILNPNEAAFDPINPSNLKCATLTRYKEKAVVVSSKSNKPLKVRIGVRLLTKAGRELMTIFSQTLNEQYFEEFIEEVRKNNKDVQISMYTYEGMDYKTMSKNLPPFL